MLLLSEASVLLCLPSFLPESCTGENTHQHGCWARQPAVRQTRYTHHCAQVVQACLANCLLAIHGMHAANFGCDPQSSKLEQKP